MGRPPLAERRAAIVRPDDEALWLGLQALADPIRLRVVRLLREREQCVCHLTAVLGVSQATVSHHMAILRRAGLVADRRDAHWTYYRLAGDSVAVLGQALVELLAPIEHASAQATCCLPDLATPIANAAPRSPEP